MLYIKESFANNMVPSQNSGLFQYQRRSTGDFLSWLMEAQDFNAADAGGS